jgi:hypothetical protein
MGWWLIVGWVKHFARPNISQVVVQLLGRAKA